MGRYIVRPSTVVRRIPQGAKLPSGFQRFADACRSRQQGDIGWFNLEYTNPNDLFPGTSSQVVPFLSLPAGDLVAFWFHQPKRAPRIVWLSSEGDAGVMASNWPEFISRLAAKKTKHPDLDERECEVFPIRGTAKHTNLSRQRREFETWIESVTPQYEDIALEGVGDELFKIVGQQRAYYEYGTPTELVLTSTRTGVKVQWYDGGLVDFPARGCCDLAPLLEKIQEEFGKPFNETSLTIFPDRTIFLDNNIKIV